MHASILAVMLAGCDSARREPTLFELTNPRQTGVTFTNRLAEDSAFNILNYLYYYNGGGVAAGDVNNDGLPDLYLTSNLESDKLYLNRGNFRFEDVTERAGVGRQPGWTSGVTMADVNGDGHLDIYVSSVSYLALRGGNVLYVNNGDGTFTDRTKEFGLDFEGYGTQAAFFDYDNDGDLDVYLLNSSAHSERGPSRAPQRSPRHPRAGDRFLRNDGARFTDVSDAAGIYGGVEGYGLGVVASDLNGDGCIDVYVANDFQENDFVYFNDCKGRFTESVATAMPHTSQFSMGVDAADFNNDGRVDVAVLDMLPERDEILKTSAAAERLELHQLKMEVGYHAQYARNTLQLNRGGGRFSDIGYLAGVQATDWSWAPLFADLDNDGRKDLFITNGIYRRPNDLDYIEYVGSPVAQAILARGIGESALELLKRMPHVPIPNYAYRNNGDLTFTNRAEQWGLAQPGFSNGAAYVDLDNDGALDLVVNNINAPASIYRNRARERNGKHYLQVRLRGSGKNPAGIGAKVILYTGAATQLMEVMPTRGFQSSVDPRLHFGLDTVTRIDSLRVVWPDRTTQLLTDVATDRTIEIAQSSAVPAPKAHSPKPTAAFTDVSSATGVDFKHIENQFNDLAVQPLMPHMLSMEGPALAVGDVNGDSLDDFYIGGARRQTGKLYLQRSGGRFIARSLQGPPPPAQSIDPATLEDVDAAFFDADGDGDLDLYVVSGGNEVWTPSPPQRDRLYFNDGRGNFAQRPDALPRLLFHQGACVSAADGDGDGDVDLFVGSRVEARMYGWTPSSWLLLNDGKGHFAVSRGNMSMGVGNAGMVTDCEWADVNADGRLDLVVVGEWMRVHAFRYEGGRLIDRTRESGLDSTNGWWNSVTTADLDNDGDTDLVLGNLGLNSAIRGSAKQPVRLYVANFDGNSTPEQVLTVYRNGRSRLFAGRDEILGAIQSRDLRDHFRTYASFADADVDDIFFPPPRLKEALVLEAYQFASAIAINDGTGRFALRPLPVEAQFAPVYASVVQDFDGDGRVDILLGGNFYGVTPARGRYDASYGLLLRGTGGANFVPVDPAESGVLIEGQIRDMKRLRGAGGAQFIVVARNNDALQFLRVRSGSSAKSP